MNLLDGSTYYQAYDMTRILGMFIALLLTMFVESVLIGAYFRKKKFTDEGCTFVVMLANVITFLMGFLLFSLGV
jgi:hypothetical protein